MIHSTSSPVPLTGKYFILHSRVGAGYSAIHRGQILGQVVSELAPYYLCKLYVADPDKIDTLAHDSILTIDQLCGIPLYDDVEVWEMEWLRLTRMIDAATREQEKAAASAKRAGRKKTAALKTFVAGETDGPVTDEEVEAFVAQIFSQRDGDGDQR